MPELRRDQVHEPNLVFAVVLIALVGVALLFSDQPIGLLYGVSLVVAVAFLLVTAYEPIREDDRYHLGTTVVVTALFGIWWLAAEQPARFPAVITGLGAIGVLVELYNLRAGTSYLRFD